MSTFSCQKQVLKKKVWTRPYTRVPDFFPPLSVDCTLKSNPLKVLYRYIKKLCHAISLCDTNSSNSFTWQTKPLIELVACYQFFWLNKTALQMFSKNRWLLNTIRFELHVQLVCRCLLCWLVVGVTFQTEMLEDSLHVCIQLWLCISALGDVGPRRCNLSKPRHQKKSFCSVKKRRLACLWELVCIISPASL